MFYPIYSHAYGQYKGRIVFKELRRILLPVIALASQKNYMSLYVCALEDGAYIAEKYAKDLGKVSVGKSCIRFKKLSDLNLEAVEKVIRIAAKYPGLVSAPKPKH